MTMECTPRCPTVLRPDDGVYICRTCADVDAENKFFDPIRWTCVSSCPETVDQHDVCKNCSEIVDGRAPFWDPDMESCVVTCTDGRMPIQGSVCKACRDIDLGSPVFDGEKCVGSCNETAVGSHCVSCAQATPLTPIWDENSRQCVACEGGLFWDGEKCVETCPEIHWDNEYTCRRCADVYADSRPIKSVWDLETEECVPCSIVTHGGEFWDGEKCVPKCPEIYIDGVCTICAEASTQ